MSEVHAKQAKLNGTYLSCKFRKGPSINYVVSKSAIFDRPLSSFLLSKAYVVNRLCGFKGFFVNI